MSSPTFDNLSQNLSPDEKKAFLARINTSLNLTFKDVDSILSQHEPVKELRSRLTSEMNKLSFFQKILLRLSAFFSNKTIQDSYLASKLTEARDELRSDIPEMIHLQREALTPVLAQKIFDLYAEAAPLKPVFDQLFQQKTPLEAGILKILDEEYPQALHRLTDIFPLDDMEQLYKKEARKNTLFTEMGRRLEKYFDTIPNSVMVKVKERLKILYYLKPLVHYPYAYLFDQFGFSPSKGDYKKYPFFSEASPRRSADYLERIYFGIYLAQKCEWVSGSLNSILQPIIEKADDKNEFPSLEEINQRISFLHQTAVDLASKIPWKELLQWCFQDPYYSVKFYIPKFSVADFYESTLKVRLNDEIEATIPHVRQRIFNDEKVFLFQNQNFRYLDNYIPGIPPAAAAYKLKGFQFSETLNIVISFLMVHFQNSVIPFLQNFTRMLSQQNKNSLATILALADELGSIKEKIQKLDKSLHPESESGKEFQTLKYELSSKPTSHKPYLQLIQSKDQEAENIIEQASEYLKNLNEQFEGLILKNIPAINSILKLPYLLDNHTETVGKVLERMNVICEKALFLIQESYELEK